MTRLLLALFALLGFAAQPAPVLAALRSGSTAEAGMVAALPDKVMAQAQPAQAVRPSLRWGGIPLQAAPLGGGSEQSAVPVRIRVDRSRE